MPTIRKFKFTSRVIEGELAENFRVKNPTFILNAEFLRDGVPTSIKLLTVTYNPLAEARNKYVATLSPAGFTNLYAVIDPLAGNLAASRYFETFRLQPESKYEYFGVNRKDGGTENGKLSHYGVYQNVIKVILNKVYNNLPQGFYLESPAININYEIKKNNQGAAQYANSETTPFLGNSIQTFLTNINALEKALKDAASSGSNPDVDKIEEIFAEVEKQSEKENNKMANGKTVGLLAPQETLGALGEAVKQGAQVAVADEAANAVLAVAEVMVGDAYPELAKTDGGKKVVKLVAATLLHHAANAGVPFIPDVEATKFACNLVMQAAARDLIQPKIAVLTPALAQLAAVGKTALGTPQG